MNNELELKLQEDFPFMKQNRVRGERNAYKRFGCECKSGWYNLIHDLCQEITEKYTEHQLPVDIVVLQVKEKFATLRFYYEYEDTPCALQAFDFIGNGKSIRFNSDNLEEEPKQRLRKEIAAIVRKYEKKSASVCEICGMDNAERRNMSKYYVRTVCNKCYEEYLSKKNKNFFRSIGITPGECFVSNQKHTQLTQREL